MNRETADVQRLRRLQRPVWMTTGAGLALLVLGAVLHWERFLHSYLYVWVFVWGLTAGALGMLLIHGLTGGGWGLVVQRPLQAAADLMPLVALLFVPLLFGMGEVWDWAGSGAESHLLEKKAWYLNTGFFLTRAAIYFLLWTLLAWAVGHGLRRRARRDPDADAVLFRLGAGGLILHVLMVTLAGVDWVLSLQPRFYSTIFGMIMVDAQLLSGLAVAVIAAVLRERKPTLAPYVSAERRRDLGNLLLAAVVMWAYLVFMQYLIVWNGNLPDEIVWYLPRMQTSWFWLGVSLLLVAFVFPLFALLLRALKESPRGLPIVAAIVLVGQLLYSFWLVEPAFRKGGFAVLWTDLAALLGVGGLWTAAFLWRLSRLPVTPAAGEARAREEVSQHA